MTSRRRRRRRRRRSCDGRWRRRARSGRRRRRAPRRRRVALDARAANAQANSAVGVGGGSDAPAVERVRAIAETANEAEASEEVTDAAVLEEAAWALVNENFLRQKIRVGWVRSRGVARHQGGAREEPAEESRGGVRDDQVHALDARG